MTHSLKDPLLPVTILNMWTFVLHICIVATILCSCMQYKKSIEFSNEGLYLWSYGHIYCDWVSFAKIYLRVASFAIVFYKTSIRSLNSAVNRVLQDSRDHDIQDSVFHSMALGWWCLPPSNSYKKSWIFKKKKSNMWNKWHRIKHTEHLLIFLSNDDWCFGSCFSFFLFSWHALDFSTPH